MSIIAVIFWISIMLIFHSYIFYPAIVKYISGRRKNKIYSLEEYPQLHIIIAAYNEENVIEEKLKSIFNSSYPIDRIKLWIGSDASTDDTDSIIKIYEDQYENISFTRFPGRTGKSGILNQLFQKIYQEHRGWEKDIFVLTDANVIFTPETVLELVKPFSDDDIGLCGATIINRAVRVDGISYQEKEYIQRENRIKLWEGRAWGTMMGAFGACYAIRSIYFRPIPANYLMEDFFITMNVLEKGAKAIANPAAICYEDLPNDLSEEFKRKIRISSGNFQNLAFYKHLLWPPFSAVAFSFFSHKVIRWIGPFLLVIILITGLVLSQWNEFYKVLFILQIAVLSLPLVDLLLKSIRINLIIMRFVSYFYAMNFALLVGFFKYIKGVRTNVWKPTKRS